MVKTLLEINDIDAYNINIATQKLSSICWYGRYLIHLSMWVGVSHTSVCLSVWLGGCFIHIYVWLGDVSYICHCLSMWVGDVSYICLSVCVGWRYIIHLSVWVGMSHTLDCVGGGCLIYLSLALGGG